MPRINVLTGEIPPDTTPEPPTPRRKARKNPLPARNSVIPIHPLLAGINDLPESVIAFLTGNAEGPFDPIRSAFKQWAYSHLDFTDWRPAWNAFWPTYSANPQAVERGPEKNSTRCDESLAPLLLRTFPRVLRKIIAARGDLESFEKAIRMQGSFEAQYHNHPRLPLKIAVFPPSMCAAGVPVVSVVQSGGIEPQAYQEARFAVGQLDAWLGYVQRTSGNGVDSSTIYRNAYQLDGDTGEVILNAAAIRENNRSINAWAKELPAQGWTKPPPKGMGPSVGELIESKIVPFVTPQTEDEQAIAALLANINATTL